MDSVALALFRFFSRTRQKAGAAVRAPGAAPHPHPHPHECNYCQSVNTYVEAFSHFKRPRFEGTASVDFVDLTKAEMSEDACTCVSDEIIQKIIHGVINVKGSVCTKLRV